MFGNAIAQTCKMGDGKRGGYRVALQLMNYIPWFLVLLLCKTSPVTRLSILIIDFIGQLLGFFFYHDDIIG